MRRPFAQAWVIVRDRLQAAQWRSRLAEAGGAINARIDTFRDLYLEVVEHSGLPMRPLAAPALNYRLVQTAIQQADLSYFSPLRGLPGLTGSMEALTGELQRGLVAPGDVLAHADPERPGHTELARIYQAYLDLLDATGWMSQDGLAGLALRALTECPALLVDVDLLVVDGFDWFEPAQRQILQALSNRVQRVLITLPGHPRWDRPVYRRFSQSYQELLAAVNVQLLPPLETAYLPAPLAALEADLFETATAPYPGEAPNLYLIEARSPAEEAREALRWLKARIVRDGIPSSQCAVLAPDPDLYFPFLRQAAAEFGLPLRFTQGRRLVELPRIAALLNLLNLPAGHFSRRALLDVLRSPFFDFSGIGLDRRQVDVLDLVSRHGKVIEGLEQWLEVISGLESQPDNGQDAQSASLPATPARQPEPEDEESAPVPVLPRGSEAARLREALQRAWQLVCPPQEALTIRDWVAWLEYSLAELGFYIIDRPENDVESNAALSGLRDALRGLLTAGQVLADFDDGPLSYDDFCVTLQSVLEGAGAPDDRTPDAIQAMRLMEARGLRFDCVVVLGLAEGSFPRVERPDPLLDEAMRRRLGLAPRLEQDQLGVFYQAVTRAGRNLLLTRPYLAESGDPWEPSPYWNAVAALFPQCVQRVRPEDLRPLSEAASVQEALFWAARQGLASPRDFPDAELRERSTRVLAANARLALLLGEPAPERDDALRALVRDRLGRQPTWSVSRLESYLGCPQRYFIEAWLGLEAHQPPDWDVDAAQLGSLLHAILEDAYQQAADPASPESVLAVLPEVADAAFAEAPARYGFRPSQLWLQQRGELLDRLQETVVGLAELEGGWQPLRFEQAFGFRGAPPLALPIGERLVRLHGFIDRIDVNDAGELRVIDYKTGSSHLAARDLIEGRRLQLAVYALAARDALGFGEPVEGFYWRIGPKGRSSLQLSKFAHEGYRGPEGAFALAEEHIARALQGIEDADFRALPLDGRCPAYCAVASWCWRYQPE